MKEFYHELPQFELEKKWEKLTKEKEQIVYEEFSPPKEGRISDKNENEKADNSSPPNKGASSVESKKADNSSPPKNGASSVESNKRKERTPEGKDPKSLKKV